MASHDDRHRAFKLRAVAEMVEREGLEWLRHELSTGSLSFDTGREVGAALVAAVGDIERLLIARLRAAADALDGKVVAIP
ncbi:MAG: hypothetical protein KGL39_59005, partial [Patescibacteria group bacterium]|nr:hypothetical protein [Patescibacteria group bacterium]